MTLVNPPPQTRIPKEFLEKPELRTFFEQNRQILFQLWQRTGGGTDDIEASLDHTNLSNIGTNTHPQIDTHLADSSIHTEDNLLVHLAGTETLTGTKTFSASLITTGNIDLGTEVLFTERADHVFTPVATRGILWVRNDAPNVLVFTDDAGTDFVIGSAATNVSISGTPVNNELAVWTGPNTIEGESQLTMTSDQFNIINADLRLSSTRKIEFGDTSTYITGTSTDKISMFTDNTVGFELLSTSYVNLPNGGLTAAAVITALTTIELGHASDTTLSRVSAGVIAVEGTNLLQADGSIPLTANWDVGAFTITGTQFISDIATGTAPFVVASTTKVANLNADTLDGIDILNIARTDIAEIFTDALTVQGAFTSLGFDDNASGERAQLSDASMAWGDSSAGEAWTQAIRGVTTGLHIITGGASATEGGAAWFYGSTHSSLPGDVLLKSSDEVFFNFDESAGDLEILTGVGSKTSALIINASQQVGIGVASPGVILDIEGSGTQSVDITETGNTITNRFGSSTSDGFIGTKTNHNLRLITNNATAVVITVNKSLQPVSFRPTTETTTNLEDVSNAINTGAAKVQGTMIYNSTTDNPVYAVGAANNSVWVDGAGTTVHTPV